MTNNEAIRTLKANYPDACFEQLREAVDVAINALTALPEKTQLSEEDATSDCISRKAAIDAILAVTGNSSVRELYEHVQENGLSDMWSGGVNAAIDIIIAVPPVHPEPYERRTGDADTLQKQSAKLFAVLQRACKHRCLSMDRYGGDSELHPTCHHEIYADVSWGECVEGKCPLLNPHKEEGRTDE